MPLEFYYIADGEAHFYSGGATKQLHSKVLQSYVEKVRSSAKRNEWKYSGSGAAFTGTFQGGADAESRVSSIYSRINCVREHGGEVLYSLTIDRTSGIYRIAKEESATDGIVISDADNSYYGFDVRDGRLVMASAFAGECHIGIMEPGMNYCSLYTEGRSWDFDPVWSATNPDKIYFCCAGLPIKTAEPVSDRPKSYSEMINEIYSAADETRGPSAILTLDLYGGTVDELLTGDKYDHVHPQSTSDGSLYYIRKPYRSASGKSNPFGCLVDALLLPARLIGALFGFLNVFTAKYSGTTLSKNRDVKNRDAGEMMIDGNLINAEKELKENRDRGDKNPGIIPRSWELRRLGPDGRDTLIRGGVTAFLVDEENGGILVSNGSHILRLTPDGKEERILTAAKVTAIY